MCDQTSDETQTATEADEAARILLACPEAQSVTMPSGRLYVKLMETGPHVRPHLADPHSLTNELRDAMAIALERPITDVQAERCRTLLKERFVSLGI